MGRVDRAIGKCSSVNRSQICQTQFLPSFLVNPDPVTSLTVALCGFFVLLAVSIHMVARVVVVDHTHFVVDAERIRL